MREVLQALASIYTGSASWAVLPETRSRPLPTAAVAAAVAFLALGAAALAVAVFGAFGRRSEAPDAFRRAEAWAAEHPSDLFGQALRFEDVAAAYPRSPHARTASEEAYSRRQSGVRALRKAEKLALESARTLIDSGDFDKAADSVDAFAAAAPADFEVSRQLLDTGSEARAMANARTLAAKLEFGNGADLLRNAAGAVEDDGVAVRLRSLAERFDSAAQVDGICRELVSELGAAQKELRGDYIAEGADGYGTTTVFAAWRTLNSYFELDGIALRHVAPFSACADAVSTILEAGGRDRIDGSPRSVEENLSWTRRNGRWFATANPGSSAVVRLAVERRVADLVKGINGKDLKLLFSISHLPPGTHREDLTKLVTRLVLTSAIVEIENVRIDSIATIEGAPGVKASGVQTTRVRKSGHRSESVWSSSFAASDGVLKLVVTPDPRFK